MRRPWFFTALQLLSPVCVGAALGPRYGGEATIGVADIPATLDPARPADAAQRLVLGLVHETLVRVDDAGGIQPGLASGWSSLAGEREWVLELDTEARFHDDAPLTAQDALRSLRRFLDAGSPAAAALAESLAPEGVYVSDPRHLSLRFRRPTPEALSPLASLAAAVTSPSGAGAGPFLPTLRVPGQRLALTAFTGHVRGRPYLDRLTINVVPDEARRTAEMAAGRLDAALDTGAPRPELGTPARLLLVLDATRQPFDAAAARGAVTAALRTADVPSFVPGAGALFAPLPVSVGDPPRGPLVMTVASDVPAVASQRVAAVLESLGMELRVEPRPPEAARGASSPLRLLLEAPETVGPTAAEFERRVLSHGKDDAAVPIASLPFRLATADGFHGVQVGRDAIARVEDAWLDR